MRGQGKKEGTEDRNPSESRWGGAATCNEAKGDRRLVLVRNLI